MKYAIISTFLLTLIAASPTTTPAGRDAAEIYLQARKMMKADPPAATNLEYHDYRPYSDEWFKVEKNAFEENRTARTFIRRARDVHEANWPGLQSLNDIRHIANELGDAALYESFQRNDAAAAETIRDMLHLVELLNKDLGGDMVRSLVATGISGLAAHRSMVIASDIRLTADPVNKRDLSIAEARKLIGELLDFREPIPLLTELVGEEKAHRGISVELDRFIVVCNQSNTERTFAAVSLACHLYRFEKGAWPKTLGELTPDYLARIPIDTFGDGLDSLGYVIIEKGLPDGGDRPMVFSRHESGDGLFYRIDEPQYSFYSTRDAAGLLHGGQFRDIANWVPGKSSPATPTTRPLP